MSQIDFVAVGRFDCFLKKTKKQKQIIYLFNVLTIVFIYLATYSLVASRAHHPLSRF